ncbi:hypothetical protein [Plantactinospora sp. GCM10030261]|uniref:hypothetical protein n=1 Tax=Plantactinospora sp. GCM10030261 TaxID=3273420 RepID=UPI00360A7785
MLRTTLVRAFLVPVAAVALLAGCSPDESADTAAGATPTGAASSEAAPSPTAAATSAAPNNKEVCAALTDDFVAGSQKIVDSSNKAIQEKWSLSKLNKQLQADLTAISNNLKKHAATAEDPQLKATIEGWSKSLAAGGKSSDPAGFMEKTLVKVGTDIDKTCQAV